MEEIREEQQEPLNEEELTKATGFTEEEREKVVEQLKAEQEQKAIATDFVGQLTQLVMDFQTKLALAYMAKVCFSTAVDLLVNHSAIQSHFAVEKLREEIKTKEQSRIVIP